MSRKDVLHTVNSPTSPTQFRVQKSFQTLLNDPTRLTICVNCIIKATVWKNTLFFHGEIPILIACSCSQQGVSETEVTRLCSPIFLSQIYDFNSLIYTHSHLIVSCWPVKQPHSCKRGTECPSCRAQRDSNDGSWAERGPLLFDCPNSLFFRLTQAKNRHMYNM